MHCDQFQLLNAFNSHDHSCSRLKREVTLVEVWPVAGPSLHFENDWNQIRKYAFVQIMQNTSSCTL